MGHCFTISLLPFHDQFGDCQDDPNGKLEPHCSHWSVGHSVSWLKSRKS